MNGKCKERISKLERLTNTGFNLSNAIQGSKTDQWSYEYASHIFTKTLMHAISIQRLLPGSAYFQENSPYINYDVPSVASLTRSIIDAYLTMYYVAIDKVDNDEHECRRLVWDFHGENRRLHKLELLGSKDPRLEEIRFNNRRMLQELDKNTYFLSLDNKKRKNIKKGNVAILLANNEICERAEIKANYYRMIFKYLSSYVHTYPFSLTQIHQLSVNNSEVEELIKVILDFATGFLCRTLNDYSSLYPETNKLLSEFKEEIELWTHVHKEFSLPH